MHSLLPPDCVSRTETQQCFLSLEQDSVEDIQFSIGPRGLQVHVVLPNSSEQKTRLGPKSETLVTNKAGIFLEQMFSIQGLYLWCVSKILMLKP